MRIKELTPLGRVPIGEPGYNFYQRVDDLTGYWVPTQKGIQIPDEQKRLVGEVKPPAWTEGGNYIVYGVTFDDSERRDHVVVGVRHGAPFAWLVQTDESYQGDGAKNLMPENYDWTQCVPWSLAQAGARTMFARAGMYPELEWLVVAKVGDAIEIFGADSELKNRVEAACGDLCKLN